MITEASGSTALRSPRHRPVRPASTPAPMIKEFASISRPAQDTNSLITGPQTQEGEALEERHARAEREPHDHEVDGSFGEQHYRQLHDHRGRRGGQQVRGHLTRELSAREAEALRPALAASVIKEFVYGFGGRLRTQTP
ncbi:hypothetical protein ACFXA2_22415 [Micromonospora chalcea]